MQHIRFVVDDLDEMIERAGPLGWQAIWRKRFRRGLGDGLHGARRGIHAGRVLREPRAGRRLSGAGGRAHSHDARAQIAAAGTGGAGRPRDVGLSRHGCPSGSFALPAKLGWPSRWRSRHCRSWRWPFAPSFAPTPRWIRATPRRPSQAGELRDLRVQPQPDVLRLGAAFVGVACMAGQRLQRRAACRVRLDHHILANPNLKSGPWKRSSATPTAPTALGCGVGCERPRHALNAALPS